MTPYPDMRPDERAEAERRVREEYDESIAREATLRAVRSGLLCAWCHRSPHLCLCTHDDD